MSHRCHDVCHGRGQLEGGELVPMEEHVDGPSWMGNILLDTSAPHWEMSEGEGWGQE